MSGEENWRIPVDAADYFGQEKKRADYEQRRPRITTPGQLLGPGLGPFAVRVDDLNGDVAAFNALYVVPPGALSSPDDTLWWMGQTIADTENGGVQMLSTFQTADAPHIQMMRAYSIVPGSGVRAFGSWQSMGGGGGPVRYQTVTLPFKAPFTSGSLLFTRIGDVVYCGGSVIRSSGSDSNFTNVTDPLPVGLRPAQTADWLAPAFALWGTTNGQWQARIPLTGSNLYTPQIRMNLAPGAVGMGWGAFTWVTNDSPAGLTPL